MEKLPKAQTLNMRKHFLCNSCTLFFDKEPLKIVKASKEFMYDEEGNKFLDCINNVAHVGHCHPHVVSEGTKQMSLLSTNTRFLHDNLVILAERIASTLPSSLSVVYFVNSGSEANDLALRLARSYTESNEVITLDHAYHGHLTSLIEISPYKLYSLSKASDFYSCPPYVHIVPCPDVYRGKYQDCNFPENADLGQMYADEIKSVVDALAKEGKKPACFIAESLQSCGGQIIYPEGYMNKAFQYVRDAGGLCIADEVQVGFGRVGSHMWAFETYGVIPDIVTMGKPMGNGHPVSAVVTTAEVSAAFHSLGTSYFNTFGGNPVSCAIALAVMDVIENEELLKNAQEIGSYLLSKLNDLKSKYSIIGDVRGIGLFIGIDLVLDRTSREPATDKASQIINSLMKKHHIILSRDGPYSNVLKFKPPMCFNKDDAVLLLEKLEEALIESQESVSTKANAL
ncbi:ethanolamine-phosphate phosphoprotein-lyase [Octopus vulgaris]|uniref:Ethanolamine-phosphate phosphoprotein-lyase n=1 Tax=Octopus vulgaris TaxID=6645 RepID=A0AA36F4Z9_OCTVU|nr:ethanolamine-phosphate phosphoprotein-lyase [Octopus vulgaris]